MWTPALQCVPRRPGPPPRVPTPAARPLLMRHPGGPGRPTRPPPRPRAAKPSDSGIDSDDEEDEYEHYEKLVTTRLLVGLDLETLNHCLVCYNCDPQRRRRVAAKELARQLLQETDSEDSE